MDPEFKKIVKLAFIFSVSIMPNLNKMKHNGVMFESG